MITAFRLCGGVMSGGGLLMSYRSLKSVQQGQTVFIAYKQSTILYDLATSSFSLLKELDLTDASNSSRKWMVRLIAYPLPFALQILHYNLDAKKYPEVARVVESARQHMEHVALAIDVTVSVLFTYYVAPCYGMGMLIGLSIEVLNEEKVLSGRVKDVWEKAWLGLAFSRLFRLAIFDDNDVWGLGLFACELGTFTWEHYLSDHYQKSSTPAAYHTGDPRVNRSHLHENPNLSIKGARHLKISEAMESLVKGVEWTKEYLMALKDHLIKDPIFVEANSLHNKKAADISDETAKEAFEAGATLLANQIENSGIQKGDSYIRYEVLQAMLRSILKTLEDDFNQEEITDKMDLLKLYEIANRLDPKLLSGNEVVHAGRLRNQLKGLQETLRHSAVSDLIQLAISGGDYCGGGKAETIEEIYKRRVIHGKEIPLKVKFLHLLSAMRKRWFDHLYGRVTQLTYRLPKGIFDPADVHFYNISLFYFDKSLKLHSEAVKNDMNITETSFCSRFYRLLLSTALDYTFWIYAMSSPNWYSPEVLLEEIAEANEVNGLPLADLNKWWIEWVKEQKYDQAKEDRLIDGIESNTIFGEQITVQREGKWVANPALLKRMFFEMGILE